MQQRFLDPFVMTETKSLHIMPTRKTRLRRLHLFLLLLLGCSQQPDRQRYSLTEPGLGTKCQELPSWGRKAIREISG